MIISWNQAVDIGHGRGRLATAPAASLARVDQAFGRPADVNEAWRSPEQANANYARYRAYLRDPKRNPWAPIALPAEESIHCRGYALDTDDTSDEQMRVWNDHGWYWTVYRDGKLVERWHLEYFPDRDNHRNDPDPRKAFLMTLSDDDQRVLFDRTNQIYTWLDAVQQALLNGREETGWGERAIDTIHRVSLDHYNRIFIRDENGKPVWDFYQEALPALRRIEDVSDEEVARLARAFADEADRRRLAARPAIT